MRLARRNRDSVIGPMRSASAMRVCTPPLRDINHILNVLLVLYEFVAFAHTIADYAGAGWRDLDIRIAGAHEVISRVTARGGTITVGDGMRAANIG